MPDTVLQLPDFIDPQECTSLIGYFKTNQSKVTTDGESRRTLSLHKSNLGDLEFRIRQAMEAHFQRPLTLSYCGYTVYEGPHNGQLYHRDDGSYAEGVQGRYGPEFHNRFGGCTLYLNQSYEPGQMQADGFEGGKLEYYDPKISITPTPGLLVGHSYHVHRVTAITGGIRYTVAAFYNDL